MGKGESCFSSASRLVLCMYSPTGKLRERVRKGPKGRIKDRDIGSDTERQTEGDRERMNER